MSDASEDIEESDSRTRRGLTVRDLAQMIFFLFLVRPFLVLFIGLRVRGREHLPVSDPFILVANHSSHLDTVSLLSLFSIARLRNVRPVAAADYFERNVFVSLLSNTLFNILPIARKKITTENNPLRRMQLAIESCQSLIVFPEGSRGSGEDVGQFRSGVAHLLEKVDGLRVVPVYLANMGRSLPKGEFLPVPFFCEIRIGAPLVLRGSRNEITARLESAVREMKEMI